MLFSFLCEKIALKFVIDCFTVSVAPALEFLARSGKVDKTIVSQLCLYSVVLSTFPPLATLIIYLYLNPFRREE